VVINPQKTDTTDELTKSDSFHRLAGVGTSRASSGRRYRRFRRFYREGFSRADPMRKSRPAPGGGGRPKSGHWWPPVSSRFAASGAIGYAGWSLPWISPARQRRSLSRSKLLCCQFFGGWLQSVVSLEIDPCTITWIGGKIMGKGNRIEKPGQIYMGQKNKSVPFYASEDSNCLCLVMAMQILISLSHQTCVLGSSVKSRFSSSAGAAIASL
jgi:hypothetical protein